MLNVSKTSLQSLLNRVASIGSVSSSRTLSTKPIYYQELIEHAKPLDVPYKKLTGSFVSTFEVKNQKILHVEPEALTLLSEQAMVDIAHLLRPAHLQVSVQIIWLWIINKSNTFFETTVTFKYS